MTLSDAAQDTCTAPTEARSYGTKHACTSAHAQGMHECSCTERTGVHAHRAHTRTCEAMRESARARGAQHARVATKSTRAPRTKACVTHKSMRHAQKHASRARCCATVCARPSVHSHARGAAVDHLVQVQLALRALLDALLHSALAD